MFLIRAIFNEWYSSDSTKYEQQREELDLYVRCQISGEEYVALNYVLL
jgi:hypothetical protein